MKLWRARPAAPNTVARRTLTGPDRKRVVEESIPIAVEIAGQWAWRLLAIIGVLIVFGLLIISLKEIVIPFMIALLISGLLAPFKSFLVRHRWPKWLAVLLAIVSTYFLHRRHRRSQRGRAAAAPPPSAARRACRCRVSCGRGGGGCRCRTRAGSPPNQL